MADGKPRVHGLGGIFFKAKDPQALSGWYAKHLGLGVEEWGGALLHWRRSDTGEPACTVWSPFQEGTDYFKPSEREFMLNFRVDDLDATLAALREEGCNVLDRGEDSEQGRFGYVVDPEGTLIELWQPNPDDPSQNSPA
ncbi:VOC family protein [Lysobacter niabensis]|uniref:VOC family protein n=1 Tax=Agrilutibacter niabensis TaxID=380628 RepID=UPI00361391D8